MLSRDALKVFNIAVDTFKTTQDEQFNDWKVKRQTDYDETFSLNQDIKADEKFCFFLNIIQDVGSKKYIVEYPYQKLQMN